MNHENRVMYPDSPTNDSSKVLNDPGICMAYAAFIRGSRSLLGLSQEDFSQILGVERTTVVRLEKGKPPLKRELCRAALELLAKAGIKSRDMTKFESQLWFDEVIEVELMMGKLVSDYLKLPKDTTLEAKQAALFGPNFKPPLSERPLRANKKAKMLLK